MGVTELVTEFEGGPAMLIMGGITSFLEILGSLFGFSDCGLSAGSKFDAIQQRTPVGRAGRS